jgi:hypothetical protein
MAVKKQVSKNNKVVQPVKPVKPIKQATSPAPASGKKQVNWTLVLILSILVGSLGVDRFVMGKIGTGILKLITWGGLGIWWIIDVILIATKSPSLNVEFVSN